MGNMVFVAALMLAQMMRQIFLGSLRAAELDRLYEKIWFAVTETCLALTIFRESCASALSSCSRCSSSSMFTGSRLPRRAVLHRAGGHAAHARAHHAAHGAAAGDGCLFLRVASQALLLEGPPSCCCLPSSMSYCGQTS